jgi:putative phosphoesterase
MRIAALYDIHANLPALEAVLEDIRHVEVDLVVIGGDVVPGPMPRTTIERLLNLDIPLRFIYGNGEIAVLEHLAGRNPEVPAHYIPVIEWTTRQLQPEYVNLLARWPKTVSARLQGLGEVLFCHATPRHENEIFTRLTPESRLSRILEGLEVSVVVCGHTHMQFERVIGGIRIVNAGSVEMPFGKTGADWLLLGPDIQFRYTPYDLSKAAECVRATDYPQAQQFAARYILKPPSEKEMLELYSNAELRSEHENVRK